MKLFFAFSKSLSLLLMFSVASAIFAQVPGAKISDVATPYQTHTGDTVVLSATAAKSNEARLFWDLAYTSGLQARQTTHLSIVGTHPSQGISRNFLGAPSTYGMQTDVMTGVDISGGKGSTNPHPSDRLIPNELERGSSATLGKSSTQSQISVIDTAIVRSTVGTTRHVYSFNASLRTVSDLTQNLKGALWVDTLRQTITFDRYGNQTSSLSEKWSNGQWVNNERHRYTYDANGKQTLQLCEYWSNDQWVDDYRLTNTYDANGKGTFQLLEYWSNGQWVNGYRRTNTFDANGKGTFQLYEYWSNGQWVNGYRNTNTYDANGNMLSCLAERWSSGRWVCTYSASYTYDANGRVLSQLGPNQRDTYTYDANGQKLSWLNEKSSNGQWEKTARRTYAYDVDGRETLSLGEVWSSGQWVNSQRDATSYDANGRVLSWLNEYWSNGQWVNGYRNTNTYDANGNRLSYLNEIWTNGQWMNVFCNMKTYDAQRNLTADEFYTWLNSSWTPSDDHTRYGYAVIDSAGNIYELGQAYSFSFKRRIIEKGVAFGSGPGGYSLLQNYPNPFNPSTTIRYSLPQKTAVKLTVFNTLGQQVAVLQNGEQEAGYHEVKFDGIGLSSGVYFCSLQAGDFLQTRKLLLTK